jgi:peptide/nickel transport system substrate-binding protein
LALYKTETDEDARTEMVKEIQAILAEEVPGFYIQTPISTYVTASDVAGFTTYPIDIYEMKDVYFAE